MEKEDARKIVIERLKELYASLEDPYCDTYMTGKLIEDSENFLKILK